MRRAGNQAFHHWATLKGGASGKGRDVIVDEERAPYIKQMFELSASGKSGRYIQRWLESNNVLTRGDKKIPLSAVYRILKNSYYYGEFEYPKDSGKWYKGKHEPLITQELFDKVQEALIVPPKGKWGAKEFPFKGFIKCYSCGSSLVGEQKLRKRKDGTVREHIYYHCSRQVDRDCKELFATEATITEELIKLSRELIQDDALLEPGLIRAIEKFGRMMSFIETKTSRKLAMSIYIRYVLKEDTMFEKTRLIRNIGIRLALHNRCLVVSTQNPVIH